MVCCLGSEKWWTLFHPGVKICVMVPAVALHYINLPGNVRMVKKHPSMIKCLVVMVNTHQQMDLEVFLNLTIKNNWLESWKLNWTHYKCTVGSVCSLSRVRGSGCSSLYWAACHYVIWVATVKAQALPALLRLRFLLNLHCLWGIQHPCCTAGSLVHLAASEKVVESLSIKSFVKSSFYCWLIPSARHLLSVTAGSCLPIFLPSGRWSKLNVNVLWSGSKMKGTHHLFPITP